MGLSVELTLGSKRSCAMDYNNSCDPSCSWAFAWLGDQLKHMQLQQLHECIKALEEERGKIEGLKRELPLCMQLLTDAIQECKDHLAECQTSSLKTTLPIKLGCNFLDRTEMNMQNYSRETPPIEEFIPLKDKPREEEEQKPATKKSTRRSDEDKPTWMAKAQLWSERQDRADMIKEEDKTAASQNQLDGLGLEGNQFCSSSPKFMLNVPHGSGGAFSPFVREKQWEGVVSSSEETSCGAKLTLSSGMSHIRQGPISVVERVAEDSGRDVVEAQRTSVLLRHANTDVVSSGNSFGGGSGHSAHATVDQIQRKARRCWSPELHRRFLNALEQLGGSHAATPKQIRELMKVDGLTNDEVKSHLQKYRLHTRRPGPVPQSGASPSPHMVVLGGIWMPSEYTTAAAAAQQSSNAYDASPSQHQSHFFHPLVKESLSKLRSSAHGQLNHTCFYDQQAASQSQMLSQRNSNCSGQLLLQTEASSEGCEDESVGDDAKSDNTSRKGDSQGPGAEDFRDNRTCKRTCQGIDHPDQHEDDEGDLSEAEDIRGSERVSSNANG